MPAPAPTPTHTHAHTHTHRHTHTHAWVGGCAGDLDQGFAQAPHVIRGGWQRLPSQYHFAMEPQTASAVGGGGGCWGGACWGGVVWCVLGAVACLPLQYHFAMELQTASAVGGGCWGGACWARWCACSHTNSKNRGDARLQGRAGLWGQARPALTTASGFKNRHAHALCFGWGGQPFVDKWVGAATHLYTSTPLLTHRPQTRRAA